MTLLHRCLIRLMISRSYDVASSSSNCRIIDLNLSFTSMISIEFIDVLDWDFELLKQKTKTSDCRSLFHISLPTVSFPFCLTTSPQPLAHSHLSTGTALRLIPLGQSELRHCLNGRDETIRDQTFTSIFPHKSTYGRGKPRCHHTMVREATTILFPYYCPRYIN